MLFTKWPILFGSLALANPIITHADSIDFFLSADDFTKLYIDGVYITGYDDYPWGTAQATVALTPGWHHIRLEYANRWGSTGFYFYYRQPKDSDFRLVPRSALRSTSQTGTAVSGLRATYSNGTVVYGEGPIAHGWWNLYQGQSSSTWGGNNPNWGVFSETLTGEIFVGDCTVPTGETTASNGWATAEGFPTWHKWMQTLTPATSNFSGRTVIEDDAGGGPDTCYFDGSAFTPVVTITGGTWTVDANNKWDDADYVGWGTAQVAYYRAQGRAPCGTTVLQQMSIECPSNSVFYNYGPVNTLKISMTNTTVTSERAGKKATRRW